ncbi:MAG: serine/threonine-protein kinase [Anaerolineae bacterium]|nr:serine/threonine-protein kinase [Anaerolineae bacterium]
MDERAGQIGRYVVLARIGSGGFATVYRVRDTNLDREVALKVMRPLLLSDPSFVKRFEQEARVVANLDHPHIVPIYDYGDIEDRLCLVMKLLPGGSLGDLIVRGRLPWEQVVQITTQIATALDYAHERGLVHRDIKPENVLLDDEGNAVLADFGLVRALESGRLTTSLSGGVLGTPAYVAPEVWNGEAGTPGTDVYRLACLVYEMITGTQLFDAPTPPATMTLHFRPPQFPESWPEGTPPGIEAVLRRALAHKPEERYPSASAFAEDLAALTADPLAKPYAALQAAIGAEKWHDAVALGETIVEQSPGYRDAGQLLARATAARVEAERAAWAAQWQAEAEGALAAGDWERALTATHRWQEFAPEDVAAEQAIARATALGEEAGAAPEPPATAPEEAATAHEEAATTPEDGVAPPAEVAALPEEAAARELVAPAQSEAQRAAAPAGQTAAPSEPQAALPDRLEGYRWRAAPEEDELAPAVPAPPSVAARLKGRSWRLWAGLGGVVLIAIVIAAVVLSGLGDEAPTEIEEAADISGTVALGEAVRGRISGTAVDIWALERAGGEAVEILLAPEAGFDAMLDVRDESGDSILSGGEVDDGAEGHVEGVIITLPARSSYAAVRRYDGSTGPYTLEVRHGDDEEMAVDEDEPPAVVAGAPGTLLIWTDRDRAAALELATGRFESEYGVEVRIERVDPSELPERFFTAVASGSEGPDIFSGQHNWLRELLADDLVRPIDLGSKRHLFLPAALAALSLDGELYGLPNSLLNLAFVYNPEIFEQAGLPAPPASWEEVMAFAAELQSHGVVAHGYIQPHGSGYHFVPVLAAYGGYLLGQSGDGYDPHDVGLDSDGALAAADWLGAMLGEGLLPAGLDWEQTVANFASGNAAMMLTGPWDLYRLRESGIPYAIAPLPGGAEAGRPFAGSDGFMISAASENADLAQIFLTDFVATAEVMRAISEVHLLPSPFIPVLETSEDEDLVRFAEAGLDGLPEPLNPEMGAVWGIWEWAMERIMSGAEEPRAAFSSAADEIRMTVAGEQ